jgi:hypothetical protein
MCLCDLYRTVAYKQFVELERVLWLNNLTESATVQMTLFHPAYNLFTYVVFNLFRQCVYFSSQLDICTLL